MPGARAEQYSVPSETTPGIGEKLRHMRKKARKTLKEVAGSAGCSESMLSKIELGHATPSLDLLSKLAETVGTSIAELFDGDGKQAGLCLQGRRAADHGAWLAQGAGPLDAGAAGAV